MRTNIRHHLAAAAITGVAAAVLATAATPVSALTTTYTAVFGAQSPNPAPPSSTVAWTVTFTRAASSTVNIGIDLLGTSGQGTLSGFTTNSGGTCVTSTPGPRGFRCDWAAGDPNTAVLTFTVNVGVGAAPPDWSLAAIVDEAGTGTLVTSQSVVIQPLPTTTTAPSTTIAATVAPTTTISPTTTTAVSATTATTTAVGNGSGGLPATGSSDTIAMLAAVFLVAGALLLALRRGAAGSH